jgi:hypothetical protein
LSWAKAGIGQPIAAWRSNAASENRIFTIVLPFAAEHVRNHAQSSASTQSFEEV